VYFPFNLTKILDPATRSQYTVQFIEAISRYSKFTQPFFVRNTRKEHLL